MSYFAFMAFYVHRTNAVLIVTIPIPRIDEAFDCLMVQVW